MTSFSKFVLINNIPCYPLTPPFNPSKCYPEYAFKGIETEETNHVYAGVREALHQLELDSEHYGIREWNPLGSLVKPGNKVVIKPNLVRDFHETDGNLFSIITHASVIRAIADYVLIALQGKGSLVIADAPQCDARPFKKLLSITGLDTIQQFYREQGIDVQMHDLRAERVEVGEKGGLILQRHPLPGDPLGYLKVNLARDSFFHEIESSSSLLCGSDYDFEETRKHHSRGIHEYYISKTILSSDVIISIPKLKTHKRTGITLNLKNMIGANGDKNYIPHYRTGSPRRGGDEFPYAGMIREAEGKLKSLILPKFFAAKGVQLHLARLIRKMHKAVVDRTGFAKIRSGAWQGNDTLWRAILDINRIILYADCEGRLRKNIQRKFFSLIDGVIAGEGEGPLNATEKKCGLIIGGFNPFLVDAVGAFVMGFHPDEISEIREGLKIHTKTILKETEKEILLKNMEAHVPNLKFKRWQGWKKIEFDGSPTCSWGDDGKEVSMTKDRILPG